LNSFGDGLNKLFRDTTAPRSSDALQRFAKLLEGPERQGLFLRLDGPAIFLIVSTVLQFPFSSLLSKTIYFFMDVLMIYKSDSKALEALRQCLDARELEKEVKRRQRHIFHQLMRRLRDLIFDHSIHTKVRRLVSNFQKRGCARLTHPGGPAHYVLVQRSCPWLAWLDGSIQRVRGNLTSLKLVDKP